MQQAEKSLRKVGKLQPSLFDAHGQEINTQLWRHDVSPAQKKNYQRSTKKIQGLLFKRGPGQGQWRKEYYAITDNFLWHLDEVLRSFMDFENYTLERIRIKDVQGGEIEYGFRLVHNQKYVELYCESLKVMSQWYDALQDYSIQKCFQHDYQLESLIGRGTFAKVFKAKRKGEASCEFAVKVFNTKKFTDIIMERDSLMKEIGVLRRLSHKNIIRLHAVYEKDEHIFLVEDLLGGGNILQRIRRGAKTFNEDNVVRLMYVLVEALAYMHHQRVLHRDIKPENLIFRTPETSSDIVIADFGLADFYNPQGKYQFTRCGTVGYVAPEVLANAPYDTRVDTFSAGVVMFILLTGKSPFKSMDKKQMYLANQNCIVDYKTNRLSDTLSFEGLDFLKGLLTKTQAERMTAYQALQHPWFAGVRGELGPTYSTLNIAFDGDLDQGNELQEDNDLQIIHRTPLMTGYRKYTESNDAISVVESMNLLTEQVGGTHQHRSRKMSLQDDTFHLHESNFASFAMPLSPLASASGISQSPLPEKGASSSRSRNLLTVSDILAHQPTEANTTSIPSTSGGLNNPSNNSLGTGAQTFITSTTEHDICNNRAESMHQKFSSFYKDKQIEEDLEDDSDSDVASEQGDGAFYNMSKLKVLDIERQLALLQVVKKKRKQ